MDVCIRFVRFPVEIEQMLEKDEKSLASFEPVEIDWPWNTPQPELNVWAHESSGSGGYSDHIFKYAAKELFGDELSGLNYQNLR